MAELIPVEAPYEVYLVDPGARASHVVTLVQEVTRLSTAESATLVHDAPSRITAFTSRQAAEDLVARFREFDAVAIVRRPGEKTGPAPPPPSVVPRPRLPIAIGLIVLGIAQVVVAFWWLKPEVNLGFPPSLDFTGDHVLSGIGGIVLGLLVFAAGIWKLRHDDLD